MSPKGRAGKPPGRSKTMAEKRKIILDVDTGSDDAVAICAALLSEELEVLGICSVGALEQPGSGTA